MQKGELGSKNKCTLPLSLCCNALQTQYQIFADDPTRKLHRPKQMLVSHSKTNQHTYVNFNIWTVNTPLQVLTIRFPMKMGNT